MDIAIIIASIVGGCLLLAALAGGSALGLHLWKPQWSRRRRIFTAAGFAALLPMLLPYFAILSDAAGEEPTDIGIALLAITVSLVFVAAVIGLPTAWWATRKVERADGHLPPPDEDDQQLPLLESAVELPAMAGTRA